MKIPENVTKKKTCKRCGMTYWGNDVDIAFREVFARHASQKYLRSICKLCEQDARTDMARKDRWGPKIQNTRRRHSESLDIPVEILTSSYGWDTKQMAHDGAHVYANGCSECHTSYKSMGHGMRDITLDIWDPNVEPVYGSNTRWICSTCNSAKGDMTPTQWATYKRLWRERDSYLIEQSIMPKLEQLELL